MAFEKNAWPSWLSNKLPTWLERVHYPNSGVGDLTDLKFSLGVNYDGRWTGFVNNGWYYYDNKENYSYNLRGTVNIAATSGGSTSPSSGFTVSPAIAGAIIITPSFRPTWGPVIVRSETDDEPYTCHANAFLPAVSLTWTSTGNIYSANVPATATLLNVRNFTNLSLGEVPGTGYLYSEKLFYFDSTNSLIYVKSNSNPPDVWVDILADTPAIRFRELVSNTSGGVLPTYTGIEDINIIRGNVSETVTGHTSGYLAHTLDAEVGDWIVLEYYIKKSYCFAAHNRLEYYVQQYPTVTGDNFIINYEKSIPDITFPISLTLPSSAEFNLNPIFPHSFRAGFLFHSDPSSGYTSYYSAEKIIVSMSRDSVCYTTNDTLHCRILVLDQSGLPIPEFPVSVVTSSGTIISSVPSVTATDRRGEINLLVQPSSAFATYTLNATAGSATGQASCSVLAYTDMLGASTWTNGRVELYISDEVDESGLKKAFASVFTLDGLPKQTKTKPLTIRSEHVARFFKNKFFANELVLKSDLSTNSSEEITGLLSFSVEKEKATSIFGNTVYAQSSIIS